MALVKVKAAIKDHWDDWTEEFPYPAPDFDVAGYQERLDEVCGKSRGRSICKLEWGGSSSIKQFTAWDSSGNPIQLDEVPKCRFKRASVVIPGTYRLIPIRRWVISELSEPEQSLPDNDFDNTFTDEYGATCKAAVKEKYTYYPYIYVGDHSNCPPNCSETRLCVGDYKHPDDAELKYLLKCFYNLKQDFFCNPYEPISKDQMERIKTELRDEHEKRQAAIDAELDAEAKDWWNCHKHRITDEDPSTLGKGYKHIFYRGKPI